MKTTLLICICLSVLAIALASPKTGRDAQNDVAEAAVTEASKPGNPGAPDKTDNDSVENDTGEDDTMEAEDDTEEDDDEDSDQDDSADDDEDDNSDESVRKRVKIYRVGRTPGGRDWRTDNQNFVPLVVIEERYSGTYIMYGIHKNKIAVNYRINLNTSFTKMSSCFGTVKDSDSKQQNVGLGFPPDGSIEVFREKVEAIKKHLLTIPSLRNPMQAISPAVVKFSYSPFADIVQAALAKERFPNVVQPKDDAHWIQQQIANGNFVPRPQPAANQTNTDLNRQSTRKPASRPAFLVAKRTIGFSENSRTALRTSPAVAKQKLIEERRLIEAHLVQLQREKIMLEAIPNQPHETHMGKHETRKGKAQAVIWRKQLAPQMGFTGFSGIKGHKILPENDPPRKTLPEEPGTHKKGADLRKLRLENGIGDYVRALQTLQEEHEELEVKIATLKKERQDMQQNIFNLSTQLSSYVTGLIETDQVAFHNLEKTLFGLNDALADQPREDQHRDPVNIAAEKLRARRIELEERAASIASQVQFIGKSVAALKHQSDGKHFFTRRQN